jgi:hypothetical protein
MTFSGRRDELREPRRIQCVATNLESRDEFREPQQKILTQELGFAGFFAAGIKKCRL